MIEARNGNDNLDLVRVRVLPDGRLDRKNAALYLGRSPKTLAQWALHGKGPRSHDVGGRAFYYLVDCDAFIAGNDTARRRGRRSPPVPAPVPPASGDVHGGALPCADVVAAPEAGRLAPPRQPISPDRPGKAAAPRRRRRPAKSASQSPPPR